MDRKSPRLKKVDGELYLDKEVKVFFDDQKIPEKYKDASLYHLVIVKRRKPNKK